MANSSKKLNISALILAKNEEYLIEGCLRQLDFVSEIILLDQNSTDQTVKIAQKYTNKILTTSDTNFSTNRNALAKAAKEEWLLYLDPDERINDQNIAEIKNTLENENYDCVYFPRKNIVLGKWIRHGGWWPDYVPRLFKKENLIGWYGEVHESPKFRGSACQLEFPITHLTARSIEQMFEKTIKWANIEAGLFSAANYPKVNKYRIIKAMVKEFLSRYLYKKGILDGKVGLIEAVYQSLHQAIIFVYLWEIQNNVEEKFKKEINE